MGLLYPLRRLYNRVRRNYRRWQTESRPYIAGLPTGLNADQLQDITTNHFSSRATSFSYKHLSAWKSSGAYRVRVRTHRGKEITLVYKDSWYGTAEIPALRDLPLRPGLPEYLVYSQSNAALTPFLPQVYLAQEVIPNLHYRYLLEDLSSDYFRAQEPNGRIQSSTLLAVLHQALRDWSETSRVNGLLRYGMEFSRALQSYVWNNLQSLYQHVQHPVIKDFLDSWQEIKHLHLEPEFYTDQPAALIHGDANFSNIHIHKRDSGRFKVVDWEWAGYAAPYADLASLLKGTSEEVEKAAFQEFTRTTLIPQTGSPMDVDETHMYRQYVWCKLERGLLDASFLAAQSINTNHSTKFSLQNAVIHALSRVQHAYHQLTQ